MPHQNYVDPFGRIQALPAHDFMDGNRGSIDSTVGKIVRAGNNTARIACRLECKARTGKPTSRRRDSELFLLDEGTALAAGYRPCRACRRSDYDRFLKFFSLGNPEVFNESRLTGAVLDAALHKNRLATIRCGSRSRTPVGELHDGVMCFDPRRPTTALLRWEGMLYPWSLEGYRAPIYLHDSECVHRLTPMPIANAIRAGYEPQLDEVIDSELATRDWPPFTLSQHAGEADPLNWLGRMWLRPNRELVGCDRNEAYALTIGGVGYARDVWGIDLYSGEGFNKVASVVSDRAIRWQSFQDLRAALFLTQKSVRWSGASLDRDTERRFQYDRLYREVCDAWDREYKANEELVVLAYSTQTWLSTLHSAEPD